MTLTQDWIHFYGYDNNSYNQKASIGGDGFFYLAGQTLGNLDGQTNHGGNDAFITKLNIDGSKEWTRLIGSSGDDFASSASAGSDGSIYVAGSTSGNLDGQTSNNGSSDAFITKLNSDGSKEWTRQFGTSLSDHASSVSVGSDGSIYLAGTTTIVTGEDESHTDAFVSKFNSDGIKQWSRPIGGTDDVKPADISIGGDGSIYVAGSINGNLDGQINNGNSDAFISKFNSNGTKEWTHLIGSSNWDEGNSVSAGSDGSVYLAGSIDGNFDGQTSNGSSDAFISKFNSNGTKEWTHLIGSSNWDGGYSVSAGSDGSVYLAGDTHGNFDGQTSNGSSDAFISKFNSNGTKEWTHLIGTPRWEMCDFVGATSDGSIYLSGRTSNSNNVGWDAFIGMFTDSSTTPPTPKTYSVTQSSTVTEGATLTTNVVTTGVAQDTSIYWSATGTGIDADDFTGGAQELEGQATVGADGKFSFTHSIKNDNKTEGNEILDVELYSDSAHTQKVGDTASTTITDTSKTPPTYSVTHSPSGTVEEGATLTTTLQTTGVDEGATIYWTADGENIDEDDFSSGELSGEGTVGADGKVTISHTLENDKTTEGNETLEFAFYSDEDHQTPVTRRSTVTVSDTSKTPPTYTISSSSPAINEGGTLNTTVRTTDLPAGTKIYWSAGGTGIDDNDFSEGELSGEGIVGEDGTFTFSHKLAYDNKTEGTETLQIKLYSNSDHTAQLGETESTKIIDTSRNSVIIAKQEGDAHAGINDDLPRGQSNVVGIRTKNLNVNGNGEFDSDVDSTSTAVATTGNGNASAHVRQSLLGISISDSSRIGGDGKFTSILTHESDNSASAVNGTADVQDRINAVSIDASNLNVHGKSNFGSYMSVRSQNSADTTQTNDENISTNASATLNRNQLLGEPNIVGMRFDNVNLGKGVFNSQVDNTSDMSANSIRGDASTLSNNSVLGIGFNGASRITGDAQVASLLNQRSFSDAQSVHGTAITEDHHSVIGVEAHDLTVTGNASFSSTVVVRALSNSGT